MATEGIPGGHKAAPKCQQEGVYLGKVPNQDREIIVETDYCNSFSNLTPFLCFHI